MPSNKEEHFKRIAVVGTGPKWKYELFDIQMEYPDIPIMAVNYAIDIRTPHITHAVSIHLEVLKELTGKLSYKVCTHCHNEADNIWVLEDPWMGMTSGLYAVRIAQLLGYETIYVAGIPLSGPYYNEVLREELESVKMQLKSVKVPTHYWWYPLTQ